MDSPTCPACNAALVLTHAGDLDTWVCPAGHGAGLTVSEAYGHLQDDEIHQAWTLAKSAPAGPRLCPMCRRPMVVVDLAFDADEDAQVAPGSATASIDVCTEDELLWFDQGEYAELPGDLPNPGPTPEEQAHIDSIAQAFGQGLVDAAHDEDAATMTGRMYAHLAAHPLIAGLAGHLHL